MRRRRFSPLAVVAYALVGFIWVPLIVVILYSFNGGSNLSWPLHGLSLRWFREMFGDAEFSAALSTSARTAAIVALIDTALALAAAVVVTRRRGRAFSTFEALGRMPAMVPPLIIGLAILNVMDVLAITPSPTTIVVGQLVVVTPFVLTVMLAALQRFDLEMEEGSRDLGAGPIQTLRRITLRVIAPAVLGGFVLGFAIAFNEVLVTNFTSGTTTTVPVFIFSKIYRVVDPSINAVASLLLLLPWLAMALVYPLVLRRGWRRAPRGQA